jgi:hypothetical protein
MAARIKEKGMEELAAFKRRVKRQGALNKIARANEEWLVEHIEEIERYVGKMQEKPELELDLW